MPTPTLIEVDADTGEVKGTGKTLEQIAEELAGEFPGYVEGSSQQLTLDVGGKPATSAEMKIKISATPMKGQFPKNKRVRFLIEGEVEDITFKTIRDKDGFIEGHRRIHHIVVDSILAL